MGNDDANGWGQRLFNQPYLLISTTMLLWSGNWVAGRYVAGLVPPVTFTTVRWILSLAILLAIGWPHFKRELPVLRAHWKVIGLLGLLSIGGYNITVYVGLQMTTVINATLLSATFPITIAVVSYVVYRDRLTLPQAVGIAIACCGALVVLTRGDISTLTAFRFNPGDLWVILSQVIWALYTVVLRDRPQVHPMAFLIATVFVGLTPLIPATAIELLAGAEVHFTPGAIAAIIYVALFAAVIAYLCFNRAIALMGANRAGPFFHLIPVFASLMAVVILGERIEPYHLLGWTIIISGIVVTQLKRRATTVR